ncbi:hypothetical protein DPMN_029163 [Dreissena polymorpha]|uniref:Uncharacterized protein n=1 Tax=Dreissena polymorpha TaxID=45954 RepID=A0A9D4LXM9_DREPO|nr:hypothetical protein DPMN_029163 [Dreissena polymorpha]
MPPPVETSQQPSRVPVNPGLASVYPSKAPAEPRFFKKCPGGAPVKASSVPAEPRSTVTHWCYTGIRPRQSYGNAPV